MGKRDEPQDRYLVPFEGKFKLRGLPTAPPKNAPDKPQRKALLEAAIEELDELQRVLYADKGRAVLCVFQAMDAAGKDSTIRAVFTGVDPAGCQVHAFKAPTVTELDHDFLWRTTCVLPQRGLIGVFNRSYYEEVLAVRVHPEFLDKQRLPPRKDDLDALWQQRYQSIREHEHHLARNGTVILKFWLNVSRAEQRDRLLARLDEPDKNWKFEAGDLRERALWGDYMDAYQDALRETSRPWAPWYAIPADSKSYMRMVVAQIVVRTLKGLKLSYPQVPPAQQAQLARIRRELAKPD